MADKQQVIKLVYEAAQAQRDASKYDADEKRRIREQAAAAKKAASEIAAGHEEAAKRKIAAAKSAAAAEAQAATAASRTAKDASRQEMVALKEKHQAAMAAWAAQQKATKAAAAEQAAFNSSVQGGASSVLSMGASMVGLSAGMGALTAAKEAWKQIAEETARAAAAAGLFQRESREAGTLVAKTAPQIVPQLLGLSSASGLNRQEANDLFRQYEGSLPAGLQKGNITREVANDLLKQTAITAARQGGATGVKGDLAGMLSSFGRVESAEQGLGQLEAIRQALTEGRGDDTPLTRSLLNVSGSLVREGGPVGTLPELAALVGTTSLTSGPMMADTRALQVVRATRGTTKEQMEKIQKEFGIQVGSKMGLEERLAKIVPKLREIDKTQDVSAFLTTAIGVPQEDSQALLEIMGNYEVLQQRFASARAGAGQGADVMRQNQAFLDSPLGRQMVGQANQEVGTYLQGSKKVGAQGLLDVVKGIQSAEPPSWNKSLEEGTYRALSFGASGRAEARANEILGMQARDAGVTFKPEAWGASPIDVIQHKMDTLQQFGLNPMQGANERSQAFIEGPLNKLVALQEQQLVEIKKLNEAAPRTEGGAAKATAAPPIPIMPTPRPDGRQ